VPVGRASERTPASIHAVLAVVLVGHALLAWYGRQIHIRSGQDDAWYLLLARALRGFRYVDLHVVGEPLHQLYPPGYPALLAMWSAIGGEGTDWLILLSILCSMAAVLLTFLATRRVLGAPFAALTTAAVGLNPALIERAGMIVSEPLFVLCVMGALALLAAPSPTRGRVIGAGALAVLAALTRSIGVVLIGALLLHWLLEKRWAAAAGLAVASALTIGAWLYWTTVAPEQFVGKSYIADAAAVVTKHSPMEILVNRTYRATRFYLGRALPTSLSVPTVPGTWIDNAAIVGLLALGLGAGCLALLRRWRALALFLMAYGALLLYWPWLVERYTIPLTPVVVPTLLAGFSAVGRVARRPRWGRALGTAFVAAIVLSGAVESFRFARTRAGCDRSLRMSEQPCLLPAERAFFGALDFIDARYPAAAIVGAAKNAPLYYYIARKTPPVGALMDQSSESLVPYLRETGVDAIILGTLHSSEYDRLHRGMVENCDAFDLDAEYPGGTYVFRVRGAGSGPGDGEACRAAREHPSR
jgi:hypothetical protein